MRYALTKRPKVGKSVTNATKNFTFNEAIFQQFAY